MSDHCVLKSICKLHIEESTSVVSKFNLDKCEYDQLREFLNVNWNSILDPSKNTVQYCCYNAIWRYYSFCTLFD